MRHMRMFLTVLEKPQIREKPQMSINNAMDKQFCYHKAIRIHKPLLHATT